MNAKRLLPAVLAALALPAFAAPAKNACTYAGAIAVDADTGKVLFEENADKQAIPASMLKMMDLLIVQEKIEKGEIKESDMVSVSKRAYETGGSQAWLDPRESFSMEDMLYALMIQSANDAAVAIAEHVAGSCEAMVALMNKRAKELGMTATEFHSVHGLPPDTKKGQKDDVTTPRDMAILARELCKHENIFKYTGESFRTLQGPFRKEPFEMRTHNPLLQDKTIGCDGLKTGYTKAAGYSLAVTVKRAGHRVIVVLMGVKGPDANAAKKFRNEKTHEILDKAFIALVE